ncbi:uncharacterized protein [Halyomorpha halys]|uniref:uncharacterized protein n=1 Tax=Halyomorpha halys TaxID=286706 RepID=UPI0034D335A4
MCLAIENPATCEVRSMIWFLFARNNRPIEINRQFCDVYGQRIISENRVRHAWCFDFENGSTSIYDEDCSGRLSLVTDDLAMQIHPKIRENPRFTIIVGTFFPNFMELHQIVVEKLGYHKFYARWVSKILTEDYKKQRLAAAQTFF